jgi:hypothetical protein
MLGATPNQGQGYQERGAMEKRAIRSNEKRDTFTTERLCDIWEKIRSDTGARKALERLDKAGFRISHLRPRDATFNRPNWADYVAALPFLSNRPSNRRVHHAASVRKYRPLVQDLRELATDLGVSFVEVRFFSSRDYPVSHVLREDLLKAASLLEHYLSWDYYVRYLNPRNAVIAELRSTIRNRTGRPYDRELNVLIDAAFRAAGYQEGFDIDPTALDRMEKRQTESRVKTIQRIRYLMNAATQPIRPSTRNRRKSRKHV